jgi:hypothetical protein
MTHSQYGLCNPNSTPGSENPTAGFWDTGGVTPADRLVYLMAVKMTTMGKGEWRAMEKSSLVPFRDVFPGPRKYVMSPVFMSRAHASWERLKAVMRDLGRLLAPLAALARPSSSNLRPSCVVCIHVPRVPLGYKNTLQK